MPIFQNGRLPATMPMLALPMKMLKMDGGQRQHTEPSQPIARGGRSLCFNLMMKLQPPVLAASLACFKLIMNHPRHYARSAYFARLSLVGAQLRNSAPKLDSAEVTSPMLIYTRLAGG